jgi:2,4-dienoyl-CoA reductase-like NADH-dependent reductase (Old Yellow Enzyme family)
VPFERLLSPGHLGPLPLRNKLAMCPMGVNLAGDDQVAWFEARARGGVGLVIVGSVSVAHPAGSFDERQASLASDLDAAELRRTVEAVHRHGAAIAAQLVHAGSQALLDIAQGRPLLVPSRKRPAAPDELSTMLTPDEIARSMAPFTAPGARMEVTEATDADLEAVVDRFTTAARRAVAIGCDGIELHAGHGYLLHSFLTPYSNQRTDRWGGDAAGRATLLVEVVRAVRDAVPPGFPVWARIGADERHRDPAQHIDDALVAMRLGIDAGLDAIHVTAYAEPMVATGITDGHTPEVPGALLPLAARVKGELDVPVVAMGRLTPEAAEEALADGVADVIAMGRPLIADPDLPRKLADGRRDRIRPCAYQYRCIGAIFTNDQVTCAVNPEAGREAAVLDGAAPASRSIVVAGGGPAGLEVARRLAERGHRVVLHEASDRLGGMLRLAEQADPNLLGLADWMAAAAVDAGVEVRLSSPVDAAAATGADVVVWAAGAAWPIDALPAGSGVVTVVGDGKAAVSVAKWAAEHGRSTMLLAPGDVLAPELGIPGRFRLVHDTRDAGVEVQFAATRDAPAGGDEVDVRRGAPVPPPADLPAALEVHVIGDAAGTGGLAPAMQAAFDLAHRL